MVSVQCDGVRTVLYALVRLGVGGERQKEFSSQSPVAQGDLVAYSTEIYIMTANQLVTNTVN